MDFLLKSLGLSPEKLEEMRIVAENVAAMLADIRETGLRVEAQNANILARLEALDGQKAPEIIVMDTVLTPRVTPTVFPQFNSPPIGGNPVPAQEQFGLVATGDKKE